MAASESLEGQVAWITGGGNGIGRAVALALSARGVRVLVTGRDEKALGNVVGEIAHGGGQGRHLVADVRESGRAKDAVTKAIATWGRLDIVVANAGQSALVPLDDHDVARADAIVQTSLKGAFYTFNAAIAEMKGPGRLLAMSSVLAKVGVPGYAAYGASTAGILGLVRAIAQEVAPRKITCNAVVPGLGGLNLADAGLADIASTGKTGKTAEPTKADVAASFPLGRFIEPEEVAEMVVYLCGASAGAITGQSLAICGGTNASLG